MAANTAVTTKPARLGLCPEGGASDPRWDKASRKRTSNQPSELLMHARTEDHATPQNSAARIA